MPCIQLYFVLPEISEGKLLLKARAIMITSRQKPIVNVILLAVN